MHANHFQVWNVHSVLNVLHSLVDKSNINKQLEVRSSIAYILVLVGDQIKLNSHKYSSKLPLRCTTTKGILTLLLETLGATVSTRCWAISPLSAFSGKILSHRPPVLLVAEKRSAVKFLINSVFRLHSLLGDFYQAIKVENKFTFCSHSTLLSRFWRTLS